MNRGFSPTRAVRRWGLMGLGIVAAFGWSGMLFAASSALITHSAGSDFAKGKIDRVVIDSNGTIRLAYQTDELVSREQFQDVWAVYCALATAADTVYVGTGPNGTVFKITGTEVQTLWPQTDTPAPSSDNVPRNEHVYAIARDVADRLLIAVSGAKGYLVRLDPKPTVVFEHPDVQYIYAIALTSDHSIFLATGPKGHLFKLDPFCQSAEIIYTVPEKNILSLALAGQFVYAGTDQKGIIYKIDSAAKTASVVYDADQTDIQALLLDSQGVLYAAAASVQSAEPQPRAGLLMLTKPAGRPDTDANTVTATPPPTLNAPSAEKSAAEASPQRPVATPTPPPAPTAKGASQVYRIDINGFVQPVFTENVVFYAMIWFDDKLWLATGNNGRLFAFDPRTEEKLIAYEDTLSGQISALSALGNRLYAGLSNPARLVRVSQQYHRQGVYESPLVDAGQPALWGKLQVEATLPDGCQVMVSCRSGNINDLASPTLSAWTEPVALDKPVDLTCPVGRFMQYRLTLNTSDPIQTAVVRRVVVSYTVPNLPPQVTAVRVSRTKDKTKPGVFEITWDAQDPNRDELTYKIEFRRLGRTGWIQIKDQLTQPRYEWDSRTVEDGRYELRITADDSKSNSPAETLTASRISDMVVVDNTPPTIDNLQVQADGNRATVQVKVVDALSAINRLSWTLNSNDQWTLQLPTDRVYDTTEEMFVFEVADLKDGQNVLAIMAIDEAGNTAIRTVEIDR